MKCHLCGEHDTSPESMEEDVALMVAHLKIVHPDEYEEPERWPDGGVVLTVDPDAMDPDLFTNGDLP